jgi:hypothetical protein
VVSPGLAASSTHSAIAHAVAVQMNMLGDRPSRLRSGVVSTKRILPCWST